MTGKLHLKARCILFVAIGCCAVPAFAQDLQSLAPLTDSVAAKGCAQSRGYHTVGGLRCQDFPAGQSSDPDQVLQQLGQTARRRIMALTETARKEDAACGYGATKMAPGANSVGPSTGGELARTLVKTAMNDAMSLSLPVATMLSIPGVTQVQYDYKGLPNGPEVRTFKISGHLEGDVDNTKVRLQMDGDVDGDKNLYVEYMVNYHKTRNAFPTWSPFLDKPVDITLKSVRDRLTTLSATAQFSEKGAHRNGVQPWHEYEYNWQAERVGASPDDIIKGDAKPDYAKYPYAGDWVGIAWGAETRFKQTTKQFVAQFSSGAAASMPPGGGAEGVIMSLNVKHESTFYLHVDFEGNITGHGVITYTLDPNLCGVAALTRQVNEQVNLLKYLPEIYAAAHMLGNIAIRRFGNAWIETPPTITAKVDKVLEKLPRIEPAAGEAEISRFVKASSSLPKDAHYAFADIEVEGYSGKRLIGPANKKNYPNVRDVAPPTPKDAEEAYAGVFKKTRPGRPGWFSDGKWLEADNNSQLRPDGSIRGPQWNSKLMDVKNMRGNDSELRILDHLAQTLPKRAKGTIKLYTQLPPCSSCAGVLEQFSAMFPDILLVTTSAGK